MIFEKGHTYHIYNQGNNRQRIFFNRENYLFFLKKIKEHVFPHGEMLAWCLMPNHFHLMVEVREVVLAKTSEGFTQNEALTTNPRTFNDSIGLMLRSYTRAINKQEGKSGSLFRKETKAECITKTEGITPSFYHSDFGTVINTHNIEEDYPQVCFDYIHQNPVRANLVKLAEEWEFSSYRDYCGLRNGKLVNPACALKYGINLEV